MAEFLIRVVDKTVPDVFKDVLLLKAGDIVAIQPDDWPWGPEELTNPDWRIFKCPKVPFLQAVAFLAPEVPTDIRKPNRTLLRRLFKLNIAALPLAARTYMEDDTRKIGSFSTNISPKALLALRVRKASVPDPTVL